MRQIRESVETMKKYILHNRLEINDYGSEAMKLQEEKIGGQVMGWCLMLRHGSGFLSGLPIYTAKEMLQIAGTLTKKAREIIEEIGAETE